MTKRKGNTIITSVSLSREFKNYIDDYNISPTFAIRKGIAIELYEKGIPQYQSDLNQKRAQILKELEKENKLTFIIEDILKLEKKLKELKEMILINIVETKQDNT